MTFDLSSLLLFGLPFGLCAGLLVYALNLRSALTRIEQQSQNDAALTVSLRVERDQALQNAIRLEADVTDEAGAIELTGIKPLLIEGAARNFKVTHPADWDLMQLLLSSSAK